MNCELCNPSDGPEPERARLSREKTWTTKMQLSAGILMYRRQNFGIEMLLVHPGGPFWMRKDVGAWSIPKGICNEAENALSAAKREFEEETGYSPRGIFIELGSFRQSSGKTILAWGTEDDFDPAKLNSNVFLLEWPPKSGRCREFPEVDRADWFPA